MTSFFSEICFHFSRKKTLFYSPKSFHIFELTKCYTLKNFHIFEFAKFYTRENFRTNFYTYFTQRFLPPPIPITNTTDGLSVSPEKGHFGSLFQALCFQKFSMECFDHFCPLLHKRDRNGKTTLEKRTC